MGQSSAETVHDAKPEEWNAIDKFTQARYCTYNLLCRIQHLTFNIINVLLVIETKVVVLYENK